MFFEDKVKASRARKFALIILDKAMEKDSSISFKAYDRLIPSQDFLQKDGFGNLISLPLQKVARKSENSVFVDADFKIIEDQWEHLSKIKRIPELEVNEFLSSNDKRIVNDKVLLKAGSINVAKSDFPTELEITLQNGILISKENMSSKGVVFLRRMASYLNPEFYSKQAMRMSTYNTPRMTVVYDENDSYIALPIGLLTNLLDNMQDLGIIIKVTDMRNVGRAIDVEFNGELRSEQETAFERMNMYENGVLSATTGFGKTVLGARLIAEKKTSTLILVHTKELALQWIERLEQFLDINYNVDECHHVSASNFSRILSQIKSKFIYGLTATPIRKDGHHHIIFMYCGPVRHKIDAKKQAEKRTFDHYIIPRFTSCRKPLYQNEEDWHISDVMKHLCESII